MNLSFCINRLYCSITLLRFIMSEFTFNNLSNKLRANSIELVSPNFVKANFNEVTGDSLTLESSCIESIAKILDALADLTIAENDSRTNNNQNHIDFVSKSYGSDGVMIFTVVIQTDTATHLDNVIDPTESIVS